MQQGEAIDFKIVRVGNEWWLCVYHESVSNIAGLKGHRYLESQVFMTRRALMQEIGRRIGQS